MKYRFSKENKKKHFEQSRSLIEYVLQLSNTLRSLIDGWSGIEGGGKLDKLSGVIKCERGLNKQGGTGKGSCNKHPNIVFSKRKNI